MKQTYVPKGFLEAIKDGDKTRWMSPDRSVLDIKRGENFTINCDLEQLEAICGSTYRVKLRSTSMWLDETQLYPSLYDRDQFDPTDGEFAQEEGFDEFMDMSDWYWDKFGSNPMDSELILFGIKWKLRG